MGWLPSGLKEKLDDENYEAQASQVIDGFKARVRETAAPVVAPAEQAIETGRQKLSGLVSGLLSSWQDPAQMPVNAPANALPAPRQPMVNGQPSTIQMSSGPSRAVPAMQPGESVGSVTMTGGPIDNSSRESFVRTAWPSMLAAAGGNQDAAEMMLAAAISENGSVGSGRPFWANNFYGIKGQGPAGSVRAGTHEVIDGQNVEMDDNFAAYHTPEQGFRGFFDFLERNPRYGNALARYRQTGDASQLFRDVNAAGYATDAAWADKVANIRANQVAPLVRGSGSGPARPPAEETQAAQAQSPWGPGSFTPNQVTAATGEGLDYETALAVCGPAAAIAFARKTGRNPTMQEAVGLAKQVGWTPQAGMAGPGSQQRLLESMGIAARLTEGTPDWSTVAADVQRGNPVILSTPGHYFVAERYNPETGEYDFGESAAVLRAARGRRWFRPEELSSLGMGEPRATLYMDSPQSPSPSVVAGRAGEQASGSATERQEAPPLVARGAGGQQVSDVPVGRRQGPPSTLVEVLKAGWEDPQNAAPYQDTYEPTDPASPSPMYGGGPPPAPAPDIGSENGGAYGPQPVPESQDDVEERARQAAQRSQIADPLASPPPSPYAPGQAESMEPRPDRFSPSAVPPPSQDVAEDQARIASQQEPGWLRWAPPRADGTMAADLPGAVRRGYEAAMAPGASLLDLVPAETPEGKAYRQRNHPEVLKEVDAALEYARRLGFQIMTGDVSFQIATEAWKELGVPSVVVAGMEINPGVFLMPQKLQLGGAEAAGMGGRTPYGTGVAGAIERGTQAVVDAGGRAIQAGRQAVGGALERNAERVAAADARMAGQGSTVAPGTLLFQPDPNQYPRMPIPERRVEGVQPPRLDPDEFASFNEAAASLRNTGDVPDGSPVEWRTVGVRIRNNGLHDGDHHVALPFYRTKAGEYIPLPYEGMGGPGTPANSAYQKAVNVLGGRKGFGVGVWTDAAGNQHPYDSPQEIIFMAHYDAEKAVGRIKNWWRGENNPRADLEVIPYVSTNRDKGGIREYRPDIIVEHNDGSIEVLEAKPAKVIVAAEDYGKKAGQVTGKMGWDVTKKAAGIIASLADKGVRYSLLLQRDSDRLMPRRPTASGKGVGVKDWSLVPGVDPRDIPALSGKQISPETNSPGNAVADKIKAVSIAAVERAEEMKAAGVPDAVRLERLTAYVRRELLPTGNQLGRQHGQMRNIPVKGQVEMPSWVKHRGPLTLDELSEYDPDAADILREMQDRGAQIGQISVEHVRHPDGTTRPRLYFEGEGDPQAAIRATGQLGQQGQQEAGFWYYDDKGPYGVGSVDIEAPSGGRAIDFPTVQRAVNTLGADAPRLVPRYNSEGQLTGFHVVGRRADGSAIPDEDVVGALHRAQDALERRGARVQVAPLSRAEVSDFAGEAGHAAGQREAIERSEQILGLRPTPRPDRSAHARGAAAGEGVAGRPGGAAEADRVGGVRRAEEADDLADDFDDEESLLAGVSLISPLPGQRPTRDTLGAINRAISEPLVGGIGGAVINQGLNPDDPEAAGKGFLAGAVGFPAATRGAGLIARAGRAATRGGEGGAMASMGGLPTVEVLRERIGRVEGLIERARAAGDTATEQDALGVLRQLQSDLVDAHSARLDLEPRIASDVGRRLEDLPPAESTIDRLGGARSPEAVRAAPGDLSGPVGVPTEMGGRQNAVLPFDPASAAAGAAAGAASGDDDEQADPLRTAGGMAVAGLLGSRQLRQVGRRWQAAQSRAAAQAAAARAAGKAPPATAGDWLRSIGYSGMIGPSTGIVNTFGNGLELVYAIPKEIARGVARGAPREAWEEGKGLLTGVMRSGGEILDALAGAHPGGGVETAGLSQRVSNPLAQLVAQAIEAPTRLFSEVPDAFFRSVAESVGERRMAAQIATREGHSGPAWSQRVGDLLNDVATHRAGGSASPEVVSIIKDGFDLSQRLTLRGEVGPRGKAFKAGIDALPFGLGNLVMPFFNTPYQMLQRQLERSPAGLAMRTQPHRFDKAYDALVGTGVAAGVGYVAMGGGITGSGPDDPQKKAMLRAQGWQPNSTLIGGQWIPNNTFGVFGPMLDTAGELGDAVRYQKKDATGRDIGGDLVKRAGAVAGNQVYLRGISDLLQAMKDPATFGESYAASTASRVIPLGATARLAGNMTDPNERAVERGDDVGSVEAIRQRVSRGLPGAWSTGLPYVPSGRETLPVAQDILGRPQENERRGIAALGPRSRTPKTDPIIQAFTDLGIDIGYPPSSFTVDGVKIEMTPAQQRMYQRAMGEAIEKGFNRANGASDRRRAEMLKTLYDDARAAASAKVQTEMGRSEIRSRVRAGAR